MYFLDGLLRSKSPCSKPPSREIISDPVELCETEVCFLHIQLMGTNVWLPNMHKITLRSIFESSLRQSQSLGTVPICIAVQCFPHDYILKIHSCRVYKKSNEPSVCHKLWSSLWLFVQVCLLTTECLVQQCVPNTGISRQFESTLLTVLQQIPVLLLWLDGHQSMELRLWKAAESFCWPARTIAPHISLHELP